MSSVNILFYLIYFILLLQHRKLWCTASSFKKSNYTCENDIFPQEFLYESLTKMKMVHPPCDPSSAPNLPTLFQPLSPISTCHMWLFHQALIVGKINVLFDRSIIVQPKHHTVPQCPWKGRQCPTSQTLPPFFSATGSPHGSPNTSLFLYMTIFSIICLFYCLSFTYKPHRLIYFNTLI